MASFVRRRFNRLLGVATLTMAVCYVDMLAGSVVARRLVGADGLAGLGVCTPAFGVGSFLATLLSVGAALVFSRTMGAFDERQAAGVFSQTMLLGLGLGLVVFLAMRFGATAYFDLTGVTGAVRFQAERYWRWQSVTMGLLPAVLTFAALVFADGDGAVALFVNLLHVAGSVVFSVVFARLTGDAGGVAGGQAFAVILMGAACGLHLLRKANHLRPRLFFSRRLLGETLVASLPDSSINLCWGLLFLIVNGFAVARYGQESLQLVALAASVIELSIVFDGIGEALLALGGMYAGEENRPALRELAAHSAEVATAEGVVCGVALFALAPEIVAWYGFAGGPGGQVAAAVRLVRTLAFAMPFMGLLMMMNTQYLVVRHAPLAVSVTFAKDLVLPVVFCLTFGRLSLDGVWLGIVAGYALAVAWPMAVIWLRYGRDALPWLIGRDDGRSIDFSAGLAEASLAVSRERIADFLRGCGAGPDAVAGATTLVEGHGRLTREANPGRVTAEYYAAVGADGAVRLIVRDTGRCADLSARLRLPQRNAQLRYLCALGCNRVECRFGKGS